MRETDLDKDQDDYGETDGVGSGNRPIDESLKNKDSWSTRGDYLVRNHVTPRTKLFLPTDCLDECHWKIEDIDVIRFATANLELSETKLEIKDIWGTGKPEESRELGEEWIGETKFLKYQPDDGGWTDVVGRKTRKQKTTRPPDIWPELWQTMSKAVRKQAADEWALLNDDFIMARKNRGMGYVEDKVESKGSGGQLEEKLAKESPLIKDPVLLARYISDIPGVMPVSPVPDSTEHRPPFI